MRIIYFDLDTLRPDHLGCYGYSRNTSPHIDRVAQEGVLFEQCYCSDAPCLPSRAALMSGKFGIHNGAVNHGGIHGDNRLQGETRGFRSQLSYDCLPTLMKENGLHTCYIGGFGERHSLYSYYAGFREIHDTGKEGLESAEDVTPSAMKWLNHNMERDDWYLHINYWDPHTPYRAPADFGNPFSDEPIPSFFNQDLINKHRALPGPHSIQDISMYDNSYNPEFPRQPGEVKNPEDMKTLIDGYDCGIRYMDEHIGRILELLETKGILENTVIIISSDHGENLGEMGIYSEHGTADSITCRIPLIIKWPGKKSGVHDFGLHYNIDLLPTLADLFLHEKRESWDGQSFASTINSGTNCGRSELILSQCAHVCQRSVRFDNWIYIRTYHDGFHLFPKEMLFDLDVDPYEQKNIAEENPRICKEAVYRLMNWHDEMMSTMPFGYHDDPLWNVISEGGPFHAKGFLSNYTHRLKISGRSGSLSELRRRHPDEFNVRQ